MDPFGHPNTFSVRNNDPMNELGTVGQAQNGPSNSGDTGNKISWEWKLRLLLLLRFPVGGLDFYELNDEYTNHWGKDSSAPASMKDAIRQNVPDGVVVKEQDGSTVVRSKRFLPSDFKILKRLIYPEEEIFASGLNDDILSFLLDGDTSVRRVAGAAAPNQLTGTETFADFASALVTASTKPPVASVEMPSNFPLEPPDNCELPTDLMDVSVSNEVRQSQNINCHSNQPCDNEVTNSEQLMPDGEINLSLCTGSHGTAENVNLPSENGTLTSSISPAYYQSPWRSPAESDAGYISGEALLGLSSGRSCTSSDEGRRDNTIMEGSPNINANVLVQSDDMRPNFSTSTVTTIASMERALDGTISGETHCSGVINQDEPSEPFQETVTMLERASNHGDCDTANSIIRTADSTSAHDLSVAEAEAVFSRFSAAAKNMILAEKNVKRNRKGFPSLEQWGHILSCGEENRALFFVGGDQTVLKWSAKKWIPVPELSLPKDSIIYGELDDDKTVLRIIDAFKLAGVELDEEFDKRREQCLDFAKKMRKGKLFVEVAELCEVVDDCDNFAFAETVERLRQKKGKLLLQNGQKVAASGVLFLRCYHSTSDFWSVMKNRLFWKKPGGATLKKIKQRLLTETYGDHFGALDFVDVVMGYS